MGDEQSLDCQMAAWRKKLLSAGLSTQDTELIIDFIAGRARKKLGTWHRNIYDLIAIAKTASKNFAEWNEKDIDSVLYALKTRTTRRGKTVSEDTYWGYLKTLKLFFGWLGKTGKCPRTVWEKVKEVRIPSWSESRCLPEEVLTEEEVLRMHDHCEGVRDQALLDIIWDSGGRSGEYRSMRLKHVEFEDGGAHVTLPESKTRARRIWVYASAPTLAVWMQNHPLRMDREAPLWVRTDNVAKGQPLGGPAVNAMLKRVAKRAGIQKRVYPHLFRHSRATFLAERGWNEAQLREFFGWAPGSPMPARYIHLAGRRMAAAMKNVYGLAPREDREPVLKPRYCPRCRESSPAGATLCWKCASPLEPGVKSGTETVLECIGRVLQRPENKDLAERLKKALARELADRGVV